MWNLKKYNKVANITKRNRLTDTENKLVVTSGEREGGRGNRGGREEKVQTIRYKISYKDILYNTGNVANIL